MKLKPLFGRIVVEEITPEEMSKGGIVIPADVKTTGAGKGLVIFASDDCKHVKANDKVLFSLYSGMGIEGDSKDWRIIKEEDVLAIFEPETLLIKLN